MPPWHAVELPDGDLDAAGRWRGRVVTLCGAWGLQVFPLEWGGLVSANGCPVCRTLARTSRH